MRGPLKSQEPAWGFEPQTCWFRIRETFISNRFKNFVTIKNKIFVLIFKSFKNISSHIFSCLPPGSLWSPSKSGNWRGAYGLSEYTPHRGPCRDEHLFPDFDALWLQEVCSLFYLDSFLAVLVLAFWHIFSGRLPLIHSLHHSNWLSFSGGVTVAYVFESFLPSSESGRECCQGKRSLISRA